MRDYRLREHLSYCLIDSRPIFLDIKNNRYFSLAGKLEEVFIRYANGADLSRQDASMLIEKDILAEHPDGSASPAPPPDPIASRSIAELPPPPNTQFIRHIPELLASVSCTHLQLKIQKFSTIIEQLKSRRKSRPNAPRQMTLDHIAAAAHSFLEARKFVPIQTCCLLDSLSMIKFLSKREIHATLIFGVTADPFRAHCWTQYEDLILNDSLGNTRLYATIGVI